ncbi:hypothetical protein HRG_008041 [Hirsutella rhossiliensis]|uniref:Rhodopsin domain-containing protein n=1 Tax=Hirsutella rhossiliensis TaxID=111463 RepID=A0A9P8SFG1_9HYPO|nr:uncharacterized protein HRG_08041 [Hirsutella rhossiliensis]KAH0960888.1 hypothetical protein HRG_08041 [Hirsutella rhossiliensis]
MPRRTSPPLRRLIRRPSPGHQANIVALGGVTIWAIYHGLGKHTNDVPVSGYAPPASRTDAPVAYTHVDAWHPIIADSIIWIFSTVVIKPSVFWLYTRSCGALKFKRWAFGLVVLCICYGVTVFVTLTTRCRPVSD